MGFPFEKITTYGRPEDCFVRVTDRFRLEGDVLHIERTMKLKASADRIVLETSIGDTISVKESS